MALIDEVKKVCDRLAPLGWRDLLLAVTGQKFDMAAPSTAELAARLAQPLGSRDIYRKHPGFADFCVDGIRAIEPGSPARSLLYHALASPLVHLPEIEALPLSESAYPTLEELDCIENYIYAMACPRLADLIRLHAELTMAVFAYQYRTASHTPHGRFADMVYSRTGVARIGTLPCRYDAIRRGFQGDVEGNAGIAVTPARYGVFLAVRRHPCPTDAILHSSTSDQDRAFLFPVHKLFLGPECLVDVRGDLQLKFYEFHRNEKPRRVQQVGHLVSGANFDLNAAPFVRDSSNSSDLVTLHSVGASALLSPVPHAQLVRTATQRLDSGQEEIARFVVPPATPENRYSTSLRLPLAGTSALPECVHIRHEVVTVANGEAAVVDLGLLPEEQQQAKLAQGGYEAAHFIDDTCDGVVAARVRGLPSLPSLLEVRPAFSLITIPACSSTEDTQRLIAQWAPQLKQAASVTCCRSKCEPLSKGRFAVNTTLPRPDVVSLKAFDPAEDTLFAVVTAPTEVSASPSRSPGKAKPPLARSFLPDAVTHACLPELSSRSSGEENDDPILYASCGWGSPFLEAMEVRTDGTDCFRDRNVRKRRG